MAFARPQNQSSPRGSETTVFLHVQNWLLSRRRFEWLPQVGVARVNSVPSSGVAGPVARNLFGLALGDVEWIDGVGGFPAQQLNFTSGLFAWRRGSGFASAYRDAFVKLLASRIAQRSGEFFTADQVVLTPIVTKNRMAWRNLSVEDHSIVLGEFLAQRSALLPDFGKARILHYSNAFAAPFRALMEERLRRQVPKFAKWLSDQPLCLGAVPARARLRKRMYATARGLRYRAFARNVIRAS